MKKLFKSKSGRFVDSFRAITVGNVFFMVVILLVAVFMFSYLLNQIFGTKIITVGRPLQVLIVGAGLTIAFYVVIKKQGALDRSDVFVIIFLLGILAALFYYLPVLIPDVFNNPTITQSALYQYGVQPIQEASVTVHDTLQSFIPIIP